jgi:hypothetical protein
MMSRRVQRWFCFGNLLIAAILAAADLAVPLKSSWLDVPAVVLISTLLASSIAVFLREPRATLLLKASATLLLVFGLLVFSALALTAAFLFGVHGHFLRDGVELVVVGFGLVIPYTLAYPLLVLAHTGRAR